MTFDAQRAALAPFAALAEVILSEAPADAEKVTLYTDCQGNKHSVTMDELRAACDALWSV